MTYRKKKDREFYRIDSEKTVTRVLNMYGCSQIEVTKSPITFMRATDEDITKVCSELEFTTAYKEAFDRISLMKVL